MGQYLSRKDIKLTDTYNSKRLKTQENWDNGLSLGVDVQSTDSPKEALQDKTKPFPCALEIMNVDPKFKDSMSANVSKSY